MLSESDTRDSAQSLATVLLSDQRADLASCPTAQLRAAAPAAVLLASWAALLASAVTPAGLQLSTTTQARPITFLHRIANACHVTGDSQLGELLCWVLHAWTGDRSRGFYEFNCLPDEVSQALTGLIDAECPGPVMVAVATRRTLGEALHDLVTVSDHLAAIDREFCRTLLQEPVAAIRDGVHARAVVDGGLLGMTPEAVVAAANRRVRQPIPQNGKRWPQLVRAVAQIQPTVELIVQLARAPQSAAKPEEVPLGSLDPDLRQVAAAALYLATADQVDLRQAAGAGLLAAAAANPAEMCTVAGFIDGLGVAVAEVDEALQELRDTQDRCVELAKQLDEHDEPDAHTSHVLALDAIASYDLVGAKAMVVELSTYLRGRSLDRRIDAAAVAADRLPADAAAEARLQLRAMISLRRDGSLEDAELLLRRLLAFMVTTRDDAELDSGREPAVPMPPHGEQQPGAESVEETADRLLADLAEAEQAGDQRRLATVLRRLSPGATDQTILGLARRFLADDQLLDALLAGVPGHRRPGLTYRFAELLTSRGESPRAVELDRRSRPPVPNGELSPGEPVPGSQWLRPRLTTPVPSRGADSTLTAAARAAAAGDVSTAVAKFEEAARAGSAVALAPAIGYATYDGRPLDGIRLYQECAPRYYGNAGLAWNLACAYAAVGRRAEAIASLRFFEAALPGPVSGDVRGPLDSFLSINGETPSTSRRDRPRPSDSSGTVALRQEAKAKRLYESGQADEAVSLLRRLLRAVPHSPGALLLLRICREDGRLDEARQAVEEIAAAGAVNWRHYTELARAALRLGRIDVARQALTDADEAGADASWTSGLWLEVHGGSATSRTVAGQRGDLLVRAVSGQLRPQEWESVVLERLRTGRGDELLDIVRQVVASDERAGLLLLDAFVTAAAETANARATVSGAAELCRVGRPTDALSLLEQVRSRVRPTELPRLVPALQQARELAGLASTSLGPGWPVPPGERGPRLDDPIDPAALPEPWKPTVVPAAGTPQAIRQALRLTGEEGLAAAVDLWTAAATADHPLALPSAFGALVSAGRPADAITLYEEKRAKFYLTATAAWNLGCAYAACGHIETAAAAFEYHARVTARAYLPEQEATLRRLFQLVGRPLPQTAGTDQLLRPEEVRPTGGEAEVEDFERRRDAHSFLTASAALRSSMIGLPQRRAVAVLHRIRELYEQLPEPGPAELAEVVRARHTAGEPDGAWSEIIEAIERYGPRPDLLAVALRLAHELGRATTLRKLLAESPLREDYTFYITLARLSDLEGDDEARRRYAGEAMRLNSASQEAALLVDSSSGWVIPKVDPAHLRRLIRAHPQIDDLVAALEQRFGGQLPLLDRQAERAMMPSPEQPGTGHQPDPAPAKAAQDGFTAAGQEDWPLAARRYQQALDLQPRNVLLASNVVACLIRLGRYDDARRIATVYDYTWRGCLRLAQVSYFEGDLGQAAEHLGRVDRLPVADDVALAQARAGLLLDRLQRPRDAALALLVPERRGMPGSAGVNAVLAAVLGHQAGDDAIAQEAIELLRAPRLSSVTAVDWVIATDRLESLGGRTGPQLPPAELDRLVAQYADEPDRLMTFLASKANQASGASATNCLVRLADVAERTGMIQTAFDARLTLLKPHSADPQLSAKALIAFCVRNRYTAGYPLVLEAMRAAGLPVTSEDEAQERNLRLIDEYREEALREKIQSTLYEIRRRPADPTTVNSLLDPLLDSLAQLVDGTGAVTAVNRLGELWRREAALLARLADRPGDHTARDELLRVLAKVRSGQSGIGSELAEEAAGVVGHWLYARWEELARARRPSPRELVRISVDSASQLTGGPVELDVTVAARVSVTDVRVVAAGQTEYLGELAAGGSRRIGLVCVGNEQPEVTVVVSFEVDGVREERSETVPIVECDPADHELRTDFSPGEVVVGERFVGRNQERDQLSRSYRGEIGRRPSRWFVTGPREVGKSSLLLSLGPTAGPPEDWPIPNVLPIYLEASDLAPRPLLEYVADKLERKLRTLPELGVAVGPLPPRPVHIADSEVFIAWCEDLRAACEPQIGFVLMLDEAQELFQVLGKRDEIRPVVNGLRKIASSGALALLICGSCTEWKMRDLLKGTLLQDELMIEPVGMLGDSDTRTVFERGFAGTARILPSAYAEVWRYTMGYPNHIHHIGQVIGNRLASENRRLVTAGLVREVGQAVARSDRALLGILDLGDEGQDSQELLRDLVYRSQGALEVIDKWQVPREFSKRHTDQLDRYVKIGLLREEEKHLCWTNEIVNLRIEDFARQVAEPPSWRGEESWLSGEDWHIVPAPAADPGVTRRIYRDDEWRVARRLLAASPGPNPTVAENTSGVLHKLLVDSLSGDAVPGVPTYHGNLGPWYLFDHIAGSDMWQQFKIQRDMPDTPANVARWIAGACDVLDSTYRLASVTHGNITPANLIRDDHDELAVVGWGHGVFRGEVSPISGGEPGYMSPGYIRRCAEERGARPTDDVFALGVVMYQLLSPENALPFDGDLTARDQADEPPAPRQLDVTEELWQCMRKAIALPDAERYASPEDFAAALRSAVPESVSTALEPLHEAAASQQPISHSFHIENSEVHVGNNRKIEVGGSITGSTVGDHNKVRDSFNQTAGSPSEVETQLAELADLVGQLQAELPQGLADAVGRDLVAFSEEARSEAPRVESLARVAGDIIDVANTLTDRASIFAQVASPVIELVQKIVEFFQN